MYLKFLMVRKEAPENLDPHLALHMVCRLVGCCGVELWRMQNGAIMTMLLMLLKK